MSKNFSFWKKQHDGDELREFNTNQEGLLWLKVKSIVRRGIIDEFLQENKIELKATKLTEQFKELFEALKKNPANSHKLLNAYTQKKNTAQLAELDLDKLVAELYKVDTFRWGADNQNDLSKYLVKKYVKDNQSYEFLLSKIDTEIAKTVQDYLVCSWYNHWSSILIEHVFKTHKIVLPTVGQIKSVDFFINELPFDLKVTYLPTNFIEDQRKIAGLKPELTFLKQSARSVGISFKNDDQNLYYQLSERLTDNGSKEALKALKQIKDFRLNLITKVKKDPKLLAKNLYEKQSDFRFGAENRIFLILIDTKNFDDSWKLKRNIDLLKPGIHKYLNSFKKKSVKDLKLKFHKEGNATKHPKEYEVLTDVIVIEKNDLS